MGFCYCPPDRIGSCAVCRDERANPAPAPEPAFVMVMPHVTDVAERIRLFEGGDDRFIEGLQERYLDGNKCCCNDSPLCRYCESGWEADIDYDAENLMALPSIRKPDPYFLLWSDPTVRLISSEIDHKKGEMTLDIEFQPAPSSPAIPFGEHILEQVRAVMGMSKEDVERYLKEATACAAPLTGDELESVAENRELRVDHSTPPTNELEPVLAQWHNGCFIGSRQQGKSDAAGYYEGAELLPHERWSPAAAAFTVPDGKGGLRLANDATDGLTPKDLELCRTIYRIIDRLPDQKMDMGNAEALWFDLMAALPNHCIELTYRRDDGVIEATIEIDVPFGTGSAMSLLDLTFDIGSDKCAIQIENDCARVISRDSLK